MPRVRERLVSPTARVVRARTSTPVVRAPETRAPSSRLSVVEAALAFARTQRKSDGPEGAERILSPREEARVRDVFARASASTQTSIVKLLALDEPVARALLLRAVAARAQMLVDDGHRDFALGVLNAFAKRMKGLRGPQLLKRATVLDLDSRVSTSAFDPLDLWRTRGAVHDPRTPDARGDNDGLFQRFTGSCGPTALQMMLAEADPVTAFALHDTLTSDSTSDAVAEFQKSILMLHGGGKALGRTESLLRARTRNALGRLSISGDDKNALLSFLFALKPASKASDRALAALRETYGFPSDDDVARMRAARMPKSDEGVDTDALLAVLHKEVTPFIGVRYRATDLFGRGAVKKHLDDVARALRRGHDVPFGIAEPPHWALLTAVKGKKPAREFLVSDPDSGRTVWVSERDFVRGSFVADQLDIARPGDKPYVDSFLLPERT